VKCAGVLILAASFATSSCRKNFGCDLLLTPGAPGVNSKDPRSLRHTASSITGFVSRPIFSISIVTSSPGCRNTGGVLAAPTP